MEKEMSKSRNLGKDDTKGTFEPNGMRSMNILSKLGGEEQCQAERTACPPQKSTGGLKDMTAFGKL